MVRDSPQLDRNKTGGSETETVLTITVITVKTQQVGKHSHNIIIMAQWFPFNLLNNHNKKKRRRRRRSRGK